MCAFCGGLANDCVNRQMAGGCVHTFRATRRFPALMRILSLILADGGHGVYETLSRAVRGARKHARDVEQP